MKYNLSEPLLRAWLPKGSNIFGHVSLQTNKYYMSFWPNKNTQMRKDAEKDFQRRKGAKGSDLSLKFRAATLGVDASIIFHPDFDCCLEGYRFPDHRMSINICSCTELDKLYEKFLHHNGIDPSTVTLIRGGEMRGSEIIENLLQTKYSFLPELHYKAEDNNDQFYLDAQSCVSFVYHMIEWAKPPLSKKITFEFFGKLFKILDSISSSPPLKREVIG